MKQFWMGLAFLSLASAAQATLITETFVVTLPSESGLYAAGHVFQITATYDNAGTVMHEWNDGVNKIAEFGSGDDSSNCKSDLSETTLCNGASAIDYAVLSDASISITGLLAPAGAVRDDVFDLNYAQYFENDADDYWSLVFQADSIAFSLKGERSSGEDQLGRDYFSLTQYFDDGVQETSGEEGPAGIMISRSSVPEPTSLALLGLGLVGVGLARRRKGQVRTV